MVQIDGYEISSLVRRGGMGEVWRGQHRATGLSVAVKTVPLDAGPSASAWFRSEVQAAAALDHPNLVRVLDHGVLQDGRGWLALEWCSGGTLLDARPDWSDLQSAAEAVLRGLAHAHARGILHRDLKAENVLRADRWKLTDFGVARLERRGWDGVVGTAETMAPEQADPRWGPQGPWTDLYGVGCMVWQLVTGHAPFGGTRDEMLAGHRSVPLPQLVPAVDLPAGLESWLRWLLAKQPEQRPAFAAHALSRLLTLGEPVVEAVGPSQPMSTGRSQPTFAWSDPASPLGADVGVTPAIDEAPPCPIVVPATWRDEGEHGVDGRLRDVGLQLLPHRSPPLVGRDPLLETLWADLGTVAEHGSPRVVVLEGPGGVGRSRIAHRIGIEAHRSGVGRWARVSLASDDVEALHELLDGPPTSARLHAWRSDRPAVLVVDDVDAPEVVASVVELLQSTEPVLWILTTTHTHPTLGARADRVLDVAPLSDLQLASALEGLLPLAPESTGHLCEHSGGLPGAAILQLHTWSRRGQLRSTEQGFVADALEESEPGVSTDPLLQLLALLRGVATWDELVHVAEHSGMDAAGHLEAAVRDGLAIITESPGTGRRVQLRDPTERARLLAAAAPDRLEQLARGALEVLDGDDDRRGELFATAGDPARAVTALMLEGHHASHRGARGIAIGRYRRAASIAEQALPRQAESTWQAHLRLVRMLREASHLEESRALHAALRDRLAGCPARAAGLWWIEQAQQLRREGHMDEMVDAAELGLTHLARIEDPRALETLDFQRRVVADMLLFAGRLERAVALLQLRSTLRDPRDEGWTHFSWGRALALQGHLDQALTRFQQAVQVAVHHDLPLLSAAGSNQAGDMAAQLGRLDAAAAHYERSAQAYRGLDHDEGCLVDVNRALLDLRRGQWADAARRARYLRSDLRIGRLALARLAVEQLASTAAAGLGDWVTFRRCMAQVHTLALQWPDLADPDFVSVPQLAHQLAMAAGRPEDAELAQQVVDLFEARLPR